MSKKACTHKAQIYSIQKNCLVCQFCGKPVSGFSGKKVEPIKKKSSKVKMGYEVQNPNIVKAEKLKSQYKSLTTLIRTEQDPVRKSELKQKQSGVKADMLKLQKDIDNGN